MKLVEAINWNRIQDEKDLEVWNRLTANFWLPEKVPLSNDIPTWETLTDEEKLLTMRVFTGLTLLDTLQSVVGVISLIPDAVTPHEEAVLTNAAFMEAVHAKSYSSIFSTLCSMQEIDEAFRWGRENHHLQEKARIVMEHYKGDDPLMKKIASVFLESFLFYSGFYLPLYFSTRGKLTNTADVIRLIVRDECMAAGHELLTPTGWKPIEQITVEDTVAQYSVDSKTITFVHPTRTSSHKAEKTISFTNDKGHVNLVVSPGHRMLFECRPYTARNPYTTFTPVVVKAGNLDEDKRVLSPYSEVVHTGRVAGRQTELTPLQRFLIAAQADGSFDRTKNQQGEYRRSGVITGTVPCKFSFSKARKIKRLQWIVDMLGWKMVEHQPAPARGNTKLRRQFQVYVPVEHVDRSKSLHHIARLDDVDYQWCVAFIEELSQWDGHVVKVNTSRITWGCVNPDNAAYVQAVAALAGYRAHLRTTEDHRSPTYSDYHRVQICTNPATRVTGQSLRVEERPGETVYGVQVPDGFLLVRNEGTVTVTGNSVHGFYIGYKFQKAFEKESPERQEEIKAKAYDLLHDLYENEARYTEELYDGVGWTEDVKKFLHYNANKALMNLGFEPLFPASATDVNPAILASLNPSADENHDFFSGSGSSYVMGKAEATEDEDWEF